MFDSITENLIRQIPHLDNIDEERLPLVLTKIYSNVISLKSQLETDRLRLTEQDSKEYLQVLNKLIVGLDVLIFQKNFEAVRKNIAFVIATAYHLKGMLVSNENSTITLDYVSSNLMSVLLFLIADDFADSLEEIQKIQCQKGICKDLVSLVRLLLKGRISDLQGMPLTEPNLADDYDEYANDLLLYQLCLAIKDISRFFYGQTGQLNVEKIYNVLDLCRFQIAGIEQDDVFLGTQKLCKYLILAFESIKRYSIFPILKCIAPNDTAWAEFLRSLCNHGRVFLWENHMEAIRQGFLYKGISSVITFPTGAGKSTIVDLKVASSYYRSEKVVYIVPTHALESQVRNKYQELFGATNTIRHIEIDGEYSNAVNPNEGDVMVMTPERFLALLSDSSFQIDNIGLVVFDEFHIVGYQQSDNLRNLSSMLMLLEAMQKINNADFVLLSAMVENGEDVKNWVSDVTNRACLLLDNKWKPTRQLQGCLVYQKKQIEGLEQKISSSSSINSILKRQLLATPYCLFSLKTIWNTTNVSDFSLVRLLNHDVLLSLGSYSNLSANRNHVAANIAVAFAKANLKVLVFVASPKVTGAIQKDLNNKINKSSLVSCLTKEELQQLNEEFGCFDVSYLKDASCAVHHSLLLPLERKAMEDSFENGDVKIMAATPTLAQGINLPADVVVIAGDDRYDAQSNSMEALRAHEILNAVGRAGRAGLSAYGTAILVPGKVVSIDNDRIDEPWFKLKDNIFSKGDACLKIEDPLEKLVENILQNGHPVNAEEKVFVHRLNGKKEDVERLLQKSFAAFIAAKNNQQQVYQDNLGKFLEMQKNDTTQDDLMVQTSVRFGISELVAEQLYNFVCQYSEEEIETLSPVQLVRDFFVVFLMEWSMIFPLLFTDNKILELLRKICSCNEGENFSSQNIELLGELIVAYMEGSNYQDLYAKMNIRKNNDAHLEVVRKFVLNFIPSVSYIFGIISFLMLHYYMSYGHSDDEFPMELKCVATLVREGVNSVQMLKFKREKQFMRVFCHNQFKKLAS